MDRRAQSARTSHVMLHVHAWLIPSLAQCLTRCTEHAAHLPHLFPLFSRSTEVALIQKSLRWFTRTRRCEISTSDADDLLLDGTARFGFPFSAWFRCPSCAIAAFLLWVQLVEKGWYSGSPSRDGCIYVISLCCVLCRLLPRELLQGFWYRQDRRDVLWVATLFLAPMGSPEGPFIEMHCLCGSACLHVASLSQTTVSSTLAPGLQVSACLWMTCPASTRRIQLHSVSFVVVCCIPGVEFSTYFECPRVLVWLKAKHTCTCDGFFLTVRRDDISLDVVCPQDWSFLLWCNYHGELLSLHQGWSVEATRSCSFLTAYLTPLASELSAVPPWILK